MNFFRTGSANACGRAALRRGLFIVFSTCIENIFCLWDMQTPCFSIFFQDSKSYKGVKLSSGQDLFSQKLVLDPSFIVPSGIANASIDILQNSSAIFGSKNINQKVARGICIAKTPLKPDVSSCLVFFPPRCEINVLINLKFFL